eukprot:CAMPEP_0206543284 /NCGR_PEP_ID=MMETSP0325_2-20121206/10746_1 /ASSEMBLY_ACC=CAM_ASM_000347 /TAXON_ID=2866 /ORGANISM="Crypthecodinium cohnii, Strain Seligo" /LENGTH=73 /DNA_ID=CAMNT_0054041643 /DNA_START=105 /DNA_END=326 /DNA_ORIENTATION=+
MAKGLWFMAGMMDGCASKFEGTPLLQVRVCMQRALQSKGTISPAFRGLSVVGGVEVLSASACAKGSHSVLPDW